MVDLKPEKNESDPMARAGGAIELGARTEQVGPYSFVWPQDDQVDYMNAALGNTGPSFPSYNVEGIPEGPEDPMLEDSIAVR